MSATKLLERAHELGMLEPNLVQDIRRQLFDPKWANASAEILAKLLVDRGLLTAIQARGLVNDVADDPGANVDPGSPPPAKGARPTSPRPSYDTDSLLELDENQNDGEEVVELRAVNPTHETHASPKGSPRSGPMTTDPRSAFQGDPTPPNEPTKMSQKPRRPKSEPAPSVEPRNYSALEPIGASLVPGSDLLLEAMGPPPPAFASEPFGGLTMPTVEPDRRVTKKVGGRFDSPWFMVGTLVLSILVLAFGGLYFLISRGPSEKMLSNAEQAYKQGSYSQAVATYDDFLKSFPQDPNVSLVRVRRGMARLRQVTDAQDWKNSLELAKSVLPEIAEEPRFDAARAELETMLPDIADGFASEAKKQSDVKRMAELVSSAKAAVVLVDNPSYLPSTRRKAQLGRIEGIQEKILAVERTLARDSAIRDAATTMASQAAAGDIQGAYGRRRQLVKDFPGAEGNELIRNATRSVSGRERDLVVVSDQKVAAPSFAESRDRTPVTSFARVSGDPIPELKGKLVFVSDGVSLFGLDASTGQPLWRRTHNKPTMSWYQPIVTGGKQFVLVFDGERLTLRDGVTGIPRWSHPMNSSAGKAAVSDEGLLYLATSDGLIWEVSIEDGAVLRQARVPQRIACSPVLDKQRETIYVVGAESTVFSLARDTLACRDAFFLGHRADSVLTPPILTVSRLLVPEVTSGALTLIHVLFANERGSDIQELGEPFRLTGALRQPASTVGRRTVFLTDAGEVQILEVDPGEQKKPLAAVARLNPSGQVSPSRFHATMGSTLWIADTRFVRLEVVAARESISLVSTNFDGDAFLAQPQVLEPAIIVTKRRKGDNAVSIQALTAKNDSTKWTTVLSSPVIDTTLNSDGSTLRVTTSAGDVFENVIPGQRDVEVHRELKKIAEPEVRMPIQRVIRLGPNSRILAGSSPSSWILEEDGVSDLVRAPLSDIQWESVGAIQAGLICPTFSGAVYLLDPKTGHPVDQVAPLLPNVTPGEVVRWSRPVPFGNEGTRFVIADNRKKIYVASLVTTPTPHLAEFARADLSASVTGALGVVDSTLFSQVVAGGETKITAFRLPNLVEETTWKFPGSSPWNGLVEVRDLVLACTPEREMIAFRNPTEPLWKSQPLGKSVHPRITEGQGKVFVAANSMFSELNLQDGKLTPVSIAAGASVGSIAAVAGNGVIVSRLGGLTFAEFQTVSNPVTGSAD